MPREYYWSKTGGNFDVEFTECQNYLAEPTQNFSCSLELTINYPRDSRFKRLVYKSKCKVYEDLLLYLRLHLPYIVDIQHVFEKCEDGTPHIHASLLCEVNCPYSAEGLVMEVVNTLTAQMPKRTQLTLYKYRYNPFLKMFKCPAICINYKETHEIGWDQYIKKKC